MTTRSLAWSVVGRVSRPAGGVRAAVAPVAAALLTLVLFGLASPRAATGQDAPSTTPVSSARAVDPAVEADARRLASELRCPVCQGLSVQDSPTELARQMKDVIRGQLAAGRTPDEVRAYFVERYGEWILLEPEPEGFNLLVYLLPLAGLLAGAVVVLLAVRRWTRREPPPAVPSAEAPPA